MPAITKTPSKDFTGVPKLEERQTDPATTRCAMDVKQCPDGSYVGRDPSRGCAFFPCPGEREFEKVGSRTPRPTSEKPSTQPVGEPVQLTPKPGIPVQPRPTPTPGKIPTYEEWWKLPAQQGKMFPTVMVDDPRGGGGQVDFAFAEYLKATGQATGGRFPITPPTPSFKKISPTLGSVEVPPLLPGGAGSVLPIGTAPGPAPPIQQPPSVKQPVPGVSPIHSKMKEIYSPLPQMQLPQMQQISMRRIFRILPIKRRTKFQK